MKLIRNLNVRNNKEKETKMKTNKTYTFAVPCSYVYEIGAESEEQARKILCEKGGLDIDGELSLEDDAYRKADFIKLNRRSTKDK